MGEGVSWMFEARVKPGKRAELEEAIADLVGLRRGHRAPAHLQGELAGALR